jgi:hypothetical protein
VAFWPNDLPIPIVAYQLEISVLVQRAYRCRPIQTGANDGLVVIVSDYAGFLALQMRQGF